ncbi:MAG: 30S ribosomal protein S9 [Planctomycetota bacterium]
MVYWATGRRKSSIARVRMMEGTGKILVNDKLMHQYFPILNYQRDILAPLRTTKCMGRYDVVATVYGGGPTGQTGALVLGIARAILKAEPKQKEALQGGGWLTRDARVTERKKYGRRKARRSTQYSKR